MKKALLAMILTGVMAASFVEPAAVWAEETAGETVMEEDVSGADEASSGRFGSLLNLLVGEDGVLSQYMPEGTDVSELMTEISQELGGEDAEIMESLEQVVGMFTNEDGSLNTEELSSLLETFLAEDETEDLGEVFDLGENAEEEFFAVKHEDIIRECLTEHFNETLEAGDVQICSPMFAKTRLLEDGTALVLGDFTFVNYTLDGTDLKELNGVAEPKLLTLRPDADGNYEVTDIETAEDGEGFTESVEFMCAEVEMDPEEFFGMDLMRELAELSNIALYLDEHPECERIEYMGEMMTREDMDAQMMDVISEMYPDLGAAEEELTEAVTE